MKLILFTVSILLISFTMRAQLAIVPASLDQRISGSELIIEGIVTSTKSFKGKNVNRIFTSNNIEVTAIFKGEEIPGSLEIITQGGELENEKLICHELISFKTGDKGIFFLISGKENTYNVYTERQGYLPYSADNSELSEMFTGTASTDEIKRKIEYITGVKSRQLKTLPETRTRSVSVPVISGFSPINLTAGTNTELTITGSGFGNSKGQGAVEFRNSDDGGNTFIRPLDTQYKTWTDTKIIVEVPTEAGTGKIRVTTGSLAATSVDPLTIRFSRTQVEYEGKAYTPLLIDQMAGGYPWRMTKNFAGDTLAELSFLRAFNRWRCISGVNWFIGSQTDIEVTERDNLNIIRFDTNEELPANVLGVCYSYYLACTQSEWYVSEFDIVFDREANWEFGPETPANNELDFESVAFHELGHGHQLAHVINPQDVMHYAIAGGSFQREPNQNDIEGAKLVIDQSNRSLCGYQPMKVITADVCEDSYFAYFKDEPPRVYPVPVTSTLNISYFLSEDNDEVDISLIDMTGRKVVQLIKAPQKKGEHTITEDLTVFGLKKGVYILRSNINRKDYSRKILSVM